MSAALQQSHALAPPQSSWSPDPLRACRPAGLSVIRLCVLAAPQFSVTSVEGSVMPAMDLGFVYMPPPPGRAQVPTSHALGLHVGLAALLGCALLRLMLVLP